MRTLGGKLRLIWVLSFSLCVLSPLFSCGGCLHVLKVLLLSNQGTPLIPSCPIGHEQYAAIFSCVHDYCFFFDALLFLWMFVFHAERTKLRLPSARWSWTKRCSNLLNFPRLFISMCSCSPHVTSVLKKKKSRKPQVTFDLRQSRWSCSCWPGAELEVTQDE